MRNTILVLVSIVLGLILSECLLRANGFRPKKNVIIGNKQPSMHVPDSVLGWRNRKGKHNFPPYSPSGKPTYMTFLENGQRRSGENSTNTEGEIVIVGGSVTQGKAVSDSETYAWKLQQKFPSLKVVNYGTGGYGSYQSLLVLEQELPRMTSPKFVIYGFIAHHEDRNVATDSWLLLLSPGAIPFATLDKNNRIVRHPPERSLPFRYLSLPFRNSLAIFPFFERVYIKIKTIKTWNRVKQKRMVTEAILLQMYKVSKEYGATLFVVHIDSGDPPADVETRIYYKGFLKKNNINFIDVDHPLTKELIVLGEGHPNGKFHTLIAERITSVLDDQLQKNNSPN